MQIKLGTAIRVINEIFEGVHFHASGRRLTSEAEVVHAQAGQ
jgi:hypothetical protein